MSAPAHVRAPLHASTEGVHFGVDIKDASGMLVGCVFGLSDVMMPTAKAMAAGPQLLELLRHFITEEGPDQADLNRARALFAEITGDAA